MFKQPFYVPPHAVERFRERVADLPTIVIRQIIQAALQDNRQTVGIQTWDKAPCVVYRAQYRDVKYMIVVQRDLRKFKDAWPIVRTILSADMETKIRYERRGWSWDLSPRRNLSAGRR